jgi:hypothetical protein
MLSLSLSSVILYLCKCFITKHFEARGVEPLFPAAMSSDVRGWFSRAISEENALSWKRMDVPGCY